ncbi:FHIPEP family type III secretion protein [Aestuariivirga sp.]|uniref:FHIPEP family type III secretion protein n=1 Tax=Aestuariivirga sp. TaxID=2650926 RepID=UPI003BACC0FE
MIILIDDRIDVTEAYRASFGREGVSAASFTPPDFDNWFHSTSGPDLAAVEAFILGDFERRETVTRAIKTRSEAPAIALNDQTGLESTLKLFAAGVDDVIRKPVHAREIIARIGAIRRRAAPVPKATDLGDLRVFNDGRDPEVGGQTLTLPRRERRMIEQFAAEVTTAVKTLLERGEQFVLVTAPEARPYVRMIVDRLFPVLPVLSHIEISRGVKLEVIASLS